MENSKKSFKELRNELFELRVKLADVNLTDNAKKEYEQEVLKIKQQITQEMINEKKGKMKK